MQRLSDEVPILVAQKGPLEGQRWSLRENLVIGRDPNCNIVIPDRQISRRHAQLSLTHQGILLEDLGSKNGTHFNSSLLVDTVFLQDGDIVQVGLTQEFIFLSSDATVPLAIDFLEDDSMQPGVLRLEKRSRRVWIGDDEIIPPLSVAQFKLLEMLYKNQDRVIPRSELIQGVWGQEQAVSVSEQALDALVRRLRDRLADVDPSHAYVVTIRGHGLRLDNPPAQSK